MARWPPESIYGSVFEDSTRDDPVELSCGSLDVGSSKGSGFSAWTGQLDGITPPAVYGSPRACACSYPKIS